jgi:hypothetical protein
MKIIEHRTPLSANSTSIHLWDIMFLKMGGPILIHLLASSEAKPCCLGVWHFEKYPLEPAWIKASSQSSPDRMFDPKHDPSTYQSPIMATISNDQSSIC